MNVFKTENQIVASEGIKVAKFSGQNAEPVHMHDFLEFIYIYSGEGTQCIDDEEYHVKKGDMLFVNLNQVHSFHTETDMSYVNFCVKPEFLSEELVDDGNIFDLLTLSLFKEFSDVDNLSYIRFEESEFMFVDQMVERMLIEFNRKSIGYKSIIKGYMSVLLSMYLRQCSIKSNITSECGVSDFAIEIVKYIDEHVFEKITLNELATKSFYNPSYFCRMFKKCYGESVKSYIQRKRISRAIDLLTKTDQSVTEIGNNVGYSDKAQFYRIFKKHTGVTPNEYRKSIN